MIFLVQYLCAANAIYMQKSLLYISGLILVMVLLSCCSNDTSLAEVDALIEVRQQIQQQHQARLDSILAQYPYDQMTDEERFECCGRFFELYRSFHLDSQSVYVQKRLELASRMSNPVYMQAAQMNKAEVMMRSGMYHEAVLCLDSVAASPVESAYLPYYFYLRRTLYGLLEDFAVYDSEKHRYHQLTQDFRDSIIRVEQEGSFIRELVRADALYADGMYDQALSLLESCELSTDINDNQEGLTAITKAQIYQAKGNREEAKHYLIRATCADLKGTIREYIALRELALLLYQEGDIEHAYRYLTCAIEDAQAGGMRSRSLEIGTIYPIVEKTYQRQETIRVRMLYGLIATIALLASVLSLFLIYSTRKRKQLATLNELLQDSNLHLQQSNQIKTVYIGHYMEMTSMLIERFDEWRKSLNQSMKNGDAKHVQNEIASRQFTQEQLNAFYRDFDEAFLAIFPNFVEDVKNILVDGTEFNIKPDERLNTDLRVLCCIRLGITDSKQIASFLRYSLSTIYNSRTRMRNLAKGNRDEFEKNITTL